MNIYKYPTKDKWAELVLRPSSSTGEEIENIVTEILLNIKTNGEDALIKLNTKFDGYSSKSIKVSNEEILQSEQEITSELKQAIELAYKNIYTFHKAQIKPELRVETQKGVVCWQKNVAIDKVGLYIPGGSAPLFSTVLMLAIPAKIAGCNEIILCTPPSATGKIHPAILYACKRCGVSLIFKTGGAQAIAAMAYGTKSVPQVNKIFGPGNQFVTLAKQLVSSQGVAIDMPAGPSEVEVLADHTAIPSFVASDLLSQAEHGANSQVILISTSEKLVNEVKKELDIQLEVLPRKEIATKALENSRAIILNSIDDAVELTNSYGPEHLIISCHNYLEISNKIHNAGSVFLGNYTPESVGDYASGTNHTLPTNGYSKAYSGVNLDSFTKKITFQELSIEGLKKLGSAVEIMAKEEQLFAHKNAVSIRLKSAETSCTETSCSSKNNKFSIHHLVRTVIKEMSPYSSARSEYTGEASIFLDANESPYNSPYNRYPDPLQKQLKDRISQIKHVPTQSIFLGNGSDEAIDILFRSFCEPNIHNAISISPSYGMYQVAAETNGVELRKALLTKEYQLDINNIEKHIDFNSRIIFLCSPNNPSGNSLSISSIIQLCEQFNGIVVVDEAYIDFSSKESLIKYLNIYPNLVILQTFSKAWGMAGIRLGMAFASKDIIDVFNKVKYPYNINMLTQEVAIKLLENQHETMLTVKTILNERTKMENALQKFIFVKRVYPSDANFILIQVNNANSLYSFLVDNSIIIRNRHLVALCDNCLRITIGSQEENKQLISTLESY